jgi:hypothetical protein
LAARWSNVWAAFVRLLQTSRSIENSGQRGGAIGEELNGGQVKTAQLGFSELIIIALRAWTF